MKKTQFIEIINNIRESWVSYVAILMFVTLGVAMFTGIGWSGKAFEASINETFQEYQFHDFEISFPYGLSRENLDEIAEVNKVDSVQGVYYSYQFFKLGDSKKQAKVISIADQSDKLSHIEGELPAAKNEIAIQKNWARAQGYKIGDTITFTADGDNQKHLLSNLINHDYEALEKSAKKTKNDSMQYLRVKKFVVTALVESPSYISIYPVTYGSSAQSSTPIDCIMFADESAFDTKSFNGYNGALLRSDSLRPYSFESDDYTNASEAIRKDIEAVTDKMAETECNKIDKAKAACIKHYQDQIDEATAELNDAETELAKSKDILANKGDELEAARAELDKLSAKIANAKVGIRDLTAAINAARSYIESHGSEMSEEALQRKKSEIAAMEASCQEKKAMLKHAESEYSQGQTGYNEGVQELESARGQVAEAENKIADNKVKLEDAKQNLKDLKKNLKKIKHYKMSVLSRQENGGSATTTVVADMYQTLKYNMASMFVIIGMLVCYSAVSRIVYKHRKLIGTKKALGMRDREIIKTYTMYAGSAAVLGCAFGLLISRFVIEPLFLRMMGENYTFDKPVYFFSVPDAVEMCGLEIALCLLAVIIACRRMLKKSAVQLLSGNDIVVGKERWFERTGWWRHRSLLGKTIVNNFFNDSRRVFAMIVGTMGCAALIVCGLSFSNTIDGSFDRQYSKIQSFDTVVCYDRNSDARGEIEQILTDKSIKTQPLIYARGAMKNADGENISSYLLAFENKDIDDVLKLYTMDGRQAKLDDSIWVSCAHPIENELDVGDSFTYLNDENESFDVPIGGIYEFYLQRPQIVTTIQGYEKVFGKKLESNAFAFNRGELDIDELSLELEKIDGYLITDNFFDNSKASFDVIASMSEAIALLFVTLSIMMALLIELNLLIMFVEEKKRELITLMLNGYSLKYAKRYIYSDTIVMTLIGILIGVGFGILMGRWNVNSMTSDASYFMQDISTTACISGAVLTAVFTLIMTLIALRRISKFKLSDITN